MTFNVFNRVLETGRNDGSNNIELLGKHTGYQAFADRMSATDTCYYEINDGANWEIGVGTLTSDTILARTTVLKSSAGDGLITLSGNNFNVFITMPAEKMVFIRPDGTIGNADPFRQTIVVDTISDMQALNPVPSTGVSVYVRANSTITSEVPDGGGDWFTWDATDASAQDGVDTFISSVVGTGNGLYKRQHNAVRVRSEISLTYGGEIALIGSVPKVKIGSYDWFIGIGNTESFFGVYETLTSLKAVSAAEIFQNGNKVTLLGLDAGVDFKVPKIYKWNSSATVTGAQLDDVNWIRPTTGSASTGNGRWELLVNLDAEATMTAGDPTPSVAHKDILILDGTTPITDFDDGHEGQSLFVIWGGVDAIDITHNASIICSGGVTITIDGSNRAAVFQRRNGVWYQIGGGATPDGPTAIASNQVTQAELMDISDAINTSGKRLGKQVLNTTSNRIFFAVGPNAGDNWRPMDDQSGISDLTPA